MPSASRKQSKDAAQGQSPSRRIDERIEELGEARYQQAVRGA